MSEMNPDIIFNYLNGFAYTCIYSNAEGLTHLQCAALTVRGSFLHFQIISVAALSVNMTPVMSV